MPCMLWIYVLSFTCIIRFLVMYVYMKWSGVALCNNMKMRYINELCYVMLCYYGIEMWLYLSLPSSNWTRDTWHVWKQDTNTNNESNKKKTITYRILRYNYNINLLCFFFDRLKYVCLLYSASDPYLKVKDPMIFQSE